MNRSIFFPFILLICFSIQLTSLAQPAERLISRTEYIDQYKDDAIREMLRSGVPASITLAQGILESGDGNSPLAKYANNHFGIKCHSGWEGPSFIQDDDAKNECFRRYYSVYDSYKDHSDFLANRSRYAFLFDLKTTDYKGWAKGLKKAGYATNPKYPDLLIRIIEENDLSQFDRVKRMPQIAETPVTKPREVEVVSTPAKAIPEIKVSDNNIKYVIAKNGDSYYKIAEENQMGLWQILKYNDVKKGEHPSAGDIVYLQPKRNKSKVGAHRVKEGENLWKVSQIYGVQLDALCKKNNLPENATISKGMVLTLR